MTVLPASTPLPVRLRSFAVDAPPALLAVVAEGAWIAVPYLLMQTARAEPVVLGPVAFAAVAAIGLVIARLSGARLAAGWTWVVVVLIAVAAVSGWLAGDGVPAALASGDVFAAVSRHQAGFLAGYALLRGTAHAVPASSERSLARLLAWGTPALAVPLLLAQALVEPARSRFESQALMACLIFVLAATLGLALARVANLGRSAGFAWHRNRVWVLAAVLAAVAAILALPAAFLVGPAVRLFVALTLPPLLLLALVASFGQITLRAVAIVGAVGLVIFAISRLALNLAPNLQPPASNPSAAGPNGQDPTATLLTWLPIVAVAAVVIVILVRQWLRRRPTTPPVGVMERRWIEPPGVGEAGLFARFGRRRQRTGGNAGAPSNAIEAYLMSLSDLSVLPELARLPDETPASHARRLRAGGVPAPEIELLAADYQLARFGATSVSSAEDRRAIARWHRLRERLRHETELQRKGRREGDGANAAELEARATAEDGHEAGAGRKGNPGRAGGLRN